MHDHDRAERVRFDARLRNPTSASQQDLRNLVDRR
jgi:hypothetical protein